MRQIILFVLVIIMGGCTHYNNLDVTQKRDNEISIKQLIHPFDMGDVIVGPWVYLEITPRWLYLLDSHSTEKFVKVFEASTGFYAGEIVDFGSGPEEIGQPDMIAALPGKDQTEDKIIVVDHAQHKIMVYETVAALSNKNYHPHKLINIDELRFPSELVLLNDSMGLAEKVKLDPNSSKFSKELARFNLSSGEWNSFISDEHAPASNFVFDVSQDHELIAAGDYGRDRLSLYDIDGTPIKHILSSDYNSKKDRIAYSNIEITDQYIFAVYSGDRVEAGTMAKDVDFLGKKIIVFDLQGNYIVTLNAETQIRSIKYHSPSKRIYLALEGDMQIGWINLEEILSPLIKNSKNENEYTSEIESREDLQTPIQFADIPGNTFNLQAAIDHAVTNKNFGNISPKGVDIMDEQSPYIYVLCNPESKNDNIVVTEITVSPSFLHGRLMMTRLSPGIITTLFIDVDTDAPEGPFEGTIKIQAKGCKEPSVLHINGAIIR